MNAVMTLPPFATTVLGLGLSLGNGSVLALVAKSLGSTVVSTLVDAAVVLVGLILWAVKGTGSVLLIGILGPIVVWFDDISTISKDVAVAPANDVSALPPFTTTVLGLGLSLASGFKLALVVKPPGSAVVSTSFADATFVAATVVVMGLILSFVEGTGSVLAMDIFDPIVVLFDDISTISNDVGVLAEALI